MEHSNHVGYTDQNNEGQISIIRDDDEFSASDTQTIFHSDLSDEGYATNSETELDSEEESNSEEELDARDDLLEEEEPPVMNNEHSWIKQTEILLDNTLDNDSPLRAVFSIKSLDMVELWALGKVKTQKINHRWPQLNAQLRQIHIREYGTGLCTPEILQGARQLLGVGGTIHYTQISNETSNNSETEQRQIRVPKGFTFVEVVDWALPALNNHGKKCIVKTVCSSWEKIQEIPEHELIQLASGNFFN